MKSVFVGLIAGLALVVVGCGPSGDDDDDSGPTYNIEDGTYTISNASVTDDCATGITAAGLEGGTTALVVNGGTVEVDGGSAGNGFDMTYSGNSLSFSETQQQDFSGDGYDCVLDVTQAVNGTLTGDNEIDISQTIDAAENSGAECADLASQFGITLPCTTEATFHLSRTGA